MCIRDRIDTPYAVWMESNPDNLIWRVFLYFVPLLAGIAIETVQFKGKKIVSVFCVGGIMVVLPFVLNAYLYFMTLTQRTMQIETVKIQRVIYNNHNTLLDSLYYKNSFLHMMLYLFIAFIVGGVLAVYCSGWQQWCNKKWIGIVITYGTVIAMHILPWKSTDILNFIKQVSEEIYIYQMVGVLGCLFIAALFLNLKNRKHNT